MSPNRFCVYEHWRTDKDQCFYVGKGNRYRPNQMVQRNRWHVAIQEKLKSSGHLVDIKIIADCLSDEDALALEKERVSFWRGSGVTLSNLADGGSRGPTGWKQTPEQRQKNGINKLGNTNRLGAVLSAETRAKISAAHTGKKLSAEHLEAMSRAASGEKNPFFGKTHSAETRAKVAEANRRRVWSEESRQKMSVSSSGRVTTKGKHWKLSEETKRRQSDGLKRLWANKRSEALAAQST